MKNYLKYLILIIFILLIACKSSPDPEIDPNDPRKKKIDDLNDEQLREHMRALFTYIENKIAQGNFEGWYDSISDSYKTYINNPDTLQRITNMSDILFNRNIVLKSPKDYFIHVVINAREGKSLEFLDYQLINKNHVKVICLFDNTTKFVYDFIYQNESWKLHINF